MTDLRLAYGYQSWTTATHLERALRRFAGVRTIGPGHPDGGASTLTMSDAPPLLWVETGVRWLPAPEEIEAAASATYLIDTHLGYEWRAAVARAFDLVFTAQRPAAERMQAAGIAAEWLPLAAPHELCGPGADLAERAYDVAFVGHAAPGSFRARLLDALSHHHTIAPRHGYMAPPEMMELYKQARVVINVPIAGDLNMRVFEATGARAVLVTAPVPGLEIALPEDAFLSVAEERIEAWTAAVERGCARSREAQEMADTAHQHVLAHHTYDDRARTILERLAAGEFPPIDARQRRQALAAGWVRWGRPRDVGRLGLAPRVQAVRQVKAVAYAGATPVVRAMRRLRHRLLKNAR